MIDIDHDQSERLAQFVGAVPGVIEFAIKAAPVGAAGEAVEACQFVQVLIGDLQLFLAGRELARHVVERGCERLELRHPRFIGRACPQIAAAEARRRPHQRSDRPQNEPLAAEPSGKKNEHAEHAELDIGDADFPIDAAVHHRLVNADREPRVRPRHADKAEDTPCAIKVLGRRRAFVLCQQFLGQLVTCKIFADELLVLGGSGQHGAAAIDDKDLSPRTLRRIGRARRSNAGRGMRRSPTL